jgi:probable HAF family extracellular repeat protein
MIDLGTLGGGTSIAGTPGAVNASGDIVGYSHIVGDDDHHAFLWTSADRMIDLGTFGGRHSEAAAINSFGQIAGASQIVGNVYHAVLWRP